MMQSMQNKRARYSGHGHGRGWQGTAGHGSRSQRRGLPNQVCQAKKVKQSRNWPRLKALKVET